MITDVQECIKPISYIKSNAADMMNFVNEKKRTSYNYSKWRIACSFD